MDDYFVWNISSKETLDFREIFTKRTAFTFLVCFEFVAIKKVYLFHI